MEDEKLMTEMDVALMVADILRRAEAFGFNVMCTGKSIVFVGAVNVDNYTLEQARSFLDGCEYCEEYLAEEEDDSE